MKIWKMAWRNIWRRKRRTLITCFSVAFGILYAVLSTGFGDWGYTKLIDDSATMGFGHVTVEPHEYNDSPSLDKRIGNSTEIRKTALGTEGVSGAMERIVGQAMMASATKSIGGMFLAIDPSQEATE
ncbi:MAG: ABC transporter permease, partial [Nitrospinota bacterium]|nr:ABC transporter permease [Nitrospinota bacterium]